MKKLLSILLVFMILTTLMIRKTDKIFAAGTTVSVGQTFTITFSLANGPEMSSGGIEIEHSSSLELLGGSWNLSGLFINDVDIGKKMGSFTFKDGAKAVSGELVTLVFKALSVDRDAYAKVRITCYNGEDVVVSGKESRQSVRIICATHTYSEWTITKQPTCTETGSKTRTCSVCSSTETQAIAALGHDIKESVIAKEPTCTEDGEETGTCARCHQDVRQVISAIGHIYGAWETVKDATCLEHGEEKRVCTVCGAVMTQETEYGDHIIGDDLVVVKEATLFEKGVMHGTCKVCGKEVDVYTSCKQVDATSGIIISCAEGVFAEGTSIEINRYEIESQRYGEAKEILDGLNGNIELYSIIAVQDGKRVQPDGTVEVTFKIPDGFSDKVIIIYISEDGNYEIVSSKTDIENRTVTAYLNHFSDYAIYDLMVAQTGDISIAWMYALIGETAVFISVLTYLLIKDRKKIKK